MGCSGTRVASLSVLSPFGDVSTVIISYDLNSDGAGLCALTFCLNRSGVHRPRFSQLSLYLSVAGLWRPCPPLCSCRLARDGTWHLRYWREPSTSREMPSCASTCTLWGWCCGSWFLVARLQMVSEWQLCHPGLGTGSWTSGDLTSLSLLRACR